MDIHPVVVGIDVSKAHLDVFDGRPSGCANTLEAITPLASRWAEQDAFIVLEAAGAGACPWAGLRPNPGDRTLRRALEQAGVAYARVNPGKARDFARAAGFLAKTDQVDARMLQALGRALQPRPAAPAEPAREQLALLHKRRDQLVHMRQQERTRLKGCDDEDARASLERHLDWLDADIQALDRRIAQAIAAAPALAAAARLLRSIPGIGPVAAATLLALVPELGARAGKTIAALAGLAPLNRDSGQHRGKRTVGGGRKRVRDALFMAAVSASRSRSRFADSYRRLRNAGKPPKLAFTALARSSSSQPTPSSETAEPSNPRHSRRISADALSGMTTVELTRP